MNTKLLANFYANESEREAVHEFLIETLKDLAVQKVFAKESIDGIYEAQETIRLAFE